MNLKPKSFLDELAALLVKYDIYFVTTKGDDIKLESHDFDLSFEEFCFDEHDGVKFAGVSTKEDYKPEDPPEKYIGDENFDD